MNICAPLVKMMKSVSAGLGCGLAGTRATNNGNLRYRSGEHDIVVEDAGIAGQTVNSFLHWKNYWNRSQR